RNIIPYIETRVALARKAAHAADRWLRADRRRADCFASELVMPPRLPEIELVNVTRCFGSTVATRDLSFSVAPGEIVALVGRTGPAKGPAMNLIMGTIAPDSGTVRVAGFDPNRDFAQLRGKLAVSFQTDRLLPWRTAAQNIALGLQILHVDKTEARRRARD